MLCRRFAAALEGPLQDAGLGKGDVEDKLLPLQQVPPLLHWLGNVCRTQDGGIPKDLLYGELATGNRAQSHPQLRLKAVCKRDTKALDVDVDGQEDLAQDPSRWRQELNRNLRRGEEKLQLASDELRMRRKNGQRVPPAGITFKSSHCGRDRHSRIGLHSHTSDAAPVPSDRDFLKRRSMITSDRRMPHSTTTIHSTTCPSHNYCFRSFYFCCCRVPQLNTLEGHPVYATVH